MQWTRAPDALGAARALSSQAVRNARRCSKTGCINPAVATLTFVYADSTAVVGPLATYSEPHSYDLCERHAVRLTAPRGWDVVRYDGDLSEPEPSDDDLTALAEAVREAGRPNRPPDPPAGPHRPHLRLLT
jgi:Protein of unknown function (DUF3499)